MARARLAASAAFLVVLLLAVAGPPAPREVALGSVAAVGWPPSSGLLVAEVVTGGASASDEYVEIANAGPSPLDLAGLEVAYVTSSGATVTRKAPRPLRRRPVRPSNAGRAGAPGTPSIPTTTPRTSS